MQKITQVSQVEVFSVFLTLAVCFNFDSIKSNRLFVMYKKLDFACYLSGDTSDLYLRGIQFKSCKSINIPDWCFAFLQTNSWIGNMTISVPLLTVHRLCTVFSLETVIDTSLLNNLLLLIMINVECLTECRPSGMQYALCGQESKNF